MSLQGEVLVRERTPGGLRESRWPFATLEDLYALCLSIRAPQVIEGLILTGTDEQDRPRSLAFEFRSITSTL